jgi:uncharacterized small protein (DUF1192 family)
MPNPNPHHARLAKKRARKPGDMHQVLRMLWQALLEAEEVLLHAEDAELTLKAVHAISQSAGQYAKLLEVGELEARLAAVETELAQQRAR